MPGEEGSELVTADEPPTMDDYTKAGRAEARVPRRSVGAASVLFPCRARLARRATPAGCRFPTPEALVSWAGLTPTARQSGPARAGARRDKATPTPSGSPSWPPTPRRTPGRRSDNRYTSCLRLLFGTCAPSQPARPTPLAVRSVDIVWVIHSRRGYFRQFHSSSRCCIRAKSLRMYCDGS
jgi:hypothetical protein